MAQFSVNDQIELTAGMTDQQRFAFQMQYAAARRDRILMLVVSFFLGALGVDRFLLGDIGLGVLKLLTGGLFGVLWLIDLFLIMGRTDRYNWTRAQQIALAVRAGAF